MTNNQLTIKMPKLGLTMTEATLVRWLKAEGDAVQQGDILFEFESDKSLMEYECPATGVLAEISVAEGQTVPVGTPVAVLQEAGSRKPVASSRQQIAGGRQQVAGSRQQAADNRQQIAGSRQQVTKDKGQRTKDSFVATPAAKRRARELNVDLGGLTGRGPEGRIQLADVEAAAQVEPVVEARTSTPLAKRMARDLDIDWTQLEGSGEGGRVVKADVLQATAAPQPDKSAGQPLFSPEPLTGLRGIIAHRMSNSAFTAPHVTLFTDADATSLVEARLQLNTELRGAVKLSYNTLLTAIVARALREHPTMNACLEGEMIRRYREIHVALAVDTERGLLAPVIRHANRLDLVAIQQTGDELIQRALAGKSLPDDLRGGTFTITNLGMFEIDGFTPIINQPQAAILGVGRIAPRPVVKEGAVVPRQMMTLSLSFDHRLVDGGPAALFLQRIKQLIERPFALMISPDEG